jgi:hypothetical protein
MKFISELNVKDPADAEEMRRHVFGRHYRVDAKGKPMEACALTAEYVKQHPDRGEAHCLAVRKQYGEKAEEHERKRLNLPAPDHSPLAFAGAEI